MAIPIQNALHDPRLFFRLDPGEPGLLRSARASDSVRRVTQQEQRNIRRLENQARRAGREVLFSRITYRFGIDGSFSSIRAGRTVVVSRERPDRSLTPLTSPDPRETVPPSSATDDTETPQEPGADPGLQRLSDRELRDRKQRLQLEIAGLENSRDPERGTVDISDQALQEIETQLAAVEREETRRSLEEQHQTVAAALAASQALAGGLVGLRLGGTVNIEELYNGLTADHARRGIDVTT